MVEDNYCFSGNLETRLKKGTRPLRFLIIINLICGAWYLQWRIFNSINVSALWLSIPLLLAEIYCYVGGVMFFIGLWNPLERRIRSLKYLQPTLPEEQIPNVDVFITCYNEPVEMVEKTARAALNMDYPVSKLKVYILDDGNSPEMRAMSQRLNIEDLQTPRLRQEVKSISQRRSQLLANLEQVETLTPELDNAQQILNKFRIKVKPTKEYTKKVLRWFEKQKPLYVPAEVWQDCHLAVLEGFEHQIIKNSLQIEKKYLTLIDLTILSYGIEIKIWDNNRHYQTNKLFTSPNLPAVNEEEGQHLKTIAEVMDSYSYISMGNQGNCLTLYKSYTAIPNMEEIATKSIMAGYLKGLTELVLQFNPSLSHINQYLVKKRAELLDTIEKEELKLSSLLRCHYIARPKPPGKPHHAKAGNINYAIFSGSTKGDFILTLDADHIPQAQFLQRVIPYFFSYNLMTGRYYENMIAFVQTPQAFYNLPSGDPFGHQAHLFYGLIQQSKDGMNSAFYTGTNAVLRREALIMVGLKNFAADFQKDQSRLEEFDLVGGVSSNSITEDMNTAMRLHSAGWRSVYHNEPLSAGLAPDDLISTLQQRLRWAQGTIQVLLRESPLTKEGLTLGQRLQYFQTMYSYFSGFGIVIFLLSPIVYFYTGIVPVVDFNNDFAFYFVPAFVLNRLTFMMASWGIPARELWRSEQYAIALFPLYIQAVISVFSGKPLSFKVTPKERQSGNYFRLIIPQVAIVVLTVGGIFWTGIQLLIGTYKEPALFLLNAGWSIYNISVLSIVIKAATWQPSEKD
ncbi:glycosyltransferase [Cyanobacterium stanieri LEGE 03274]|uniref:Glycosyltransferase n=1 Tax=Cyanobacterium stanieri LEGE 03274 TaxID=1828756 RepID=A0ABR9V3Q5_9CHRO|nr:glycosyltransferase family 2 protein [Cyanobacterium stanieri]MBE9222525.1 glycosyltransferase [Cyanobacterium stanieri LEGE 03274]